MKKFIVSTLSFVFGWMIFLGTPSNALALNRGPNCECQGFNAVRVADVNACNHLRAEDFKNLNPYVYGFEIDDARGGSNFPGDRNNHITTYVGLVPFTPQSVPVESCDDCIAECEELYAESMQKMTGVLHTIYLAIENTFTPQGCVKLHSSSKTTNTYCEEGDGGSTDTQTEHHQIFKRER